MEGVKEEKAPSRLTYTEIYELMHSNEPGNVEKLIAEYDSVRQDIKDNGPLSEDESSEEEDAPSTPTRTATGARRNNEKPKRSFSQISDDRPYPRGRIPAGSGRQPKSKKSKLMQKIIGRKNARPVPMPGM